MGRLPKKTRATASRRCSSSPASSGPTLLTPESTTYAKPDEYGRRPFDHAVGDALHPGEAPGRPPDRPRPRRFTRVEKGRRLSNRQIAAIPRPSRADCRNCTDAAPAVVRLPSPRPASSASNRAEPSPGTRHRHPAPGTRAERDLTLLAPPHHSESSPGPTTDHAPAASPGSTCSSPMTVPVPPARPGSSATARSTGSNPEGRSTPTAGG